MITTSYFRCCCSLCSSSLSECFADDQLRLEAFQLSSVLTEIMEKEDPENVLNLLNRAERLLELRTLLGFKFIHQLEAAAAVFNVAMLAGNMEKAKGVAEVGEQMALVRCGEGPIVEDWRTKKTDPVVYLLG